MPYIKNENNRREELRNGVIALTAGELNFQIFSYILDIGTKKGFHRYNKLIVIKMVKNFLGDQPNYQKYNDMVGCLTCCYKELKRRYDAKINFLLNIIDMYDNQIADYEDIKIKENGDV